MEMGCNMRSCYKREKSQWEFFWAVRITQNTIQTVGGRIFPILRKHRYFWMKVILHKYRLFLDEKTLVNQLPFILRPIRWDVKSFLLS